ncbi:MAG: hypothetical protein ACXVA0_17765 [Mucilaginibacter sp.]
MELDKKRHVIVPLLDELRLYNHSIGSYDKSMLTDSFDYSVKLSNGLMRLPMELVDDFEISRGAITPSRFKSAALTFAPSQPTFSSVPPITPSVQQPEVEKKGSSVFRKFVIAIVIVIVVLFLISQAQKRSKQNEVEALKTEIRNNIKSYVTASGSSYNYRLIGGISDFKVTVTNNTDFSLDMVKVRVAYLKQNGGVYKYEELSFPNISPHNEMTLAAPDSDRGTQVQYEIETISSSQLGL